MLNLQMVEQSVYFLLDGTPLASVALQGSVERSNGTFLPVAPAVVNGNRVYVLTEFSPDKDAVILPRFLTLSFTYFLSQSRAGTFRGFEQ